MEAFDITDVLDTDVPFGNSIFQIQQFTDGRETPERRYRHCMLQLSQKYKALQECDFRRKRIDIDIDEIKEKLVSAEGFGLRRLTIDLDEKEYHLSVELKLIKDCFVEIAAYTQIIDNLPKFTRKEFEEAEPIYWQKRLIENARIELLSSGTVSVGTIQAIENIGIKMGTNVDGQLIYELFCPDTTGLPEVSE